MAITRWDPFDGLTPLREVVNQMLEESVLRPMRFGLMARTFPIDVFETAGAFVIEAMLPGVKTDDVQVTAVRDRVTIHVNIKPSEHTDKDAAKDGSNNGSKGEAKGHAKDEAKAGYYLRRERFEGEMTRVIDLPSDIDVEHLTAAFEHGVLTLRAPKAEIVPPKQVKITTTAPAAVN